MRNKEIEGYKRKHRDALRKEKYPEMAELLRDIAKEIGTKLPDGIADNQKKDIIQLNASIHDVLQTEMMFNACVFAKWSCFFAAVAAIVACASVVLNMCLN